VFWPGALAQLWDLEVYYGNLAHVVRQRDVFRFVVGRVVRAEDRVLDLKDDCRPLGLNILRQRVLALDSQKVRAFYL